MKKEIFFAVIFVFLANGLFGQTGTWFCNMRTHSELVWQTIETEHFNIHFHQGLDEIAKKSAIISEQVYEPIMKQLEMEDFGKADLVLTAEDEIMNGFAMPSNMIFIWVHQNRTAGWFVGDEKWLKTVIAHEFQHIVLMNAVKTWAGVWNLLAVPAWFIEGTAEYFTEHWRVGRSDLRMKIFTYKNKMENLDPHDQGYAKVLYFAEKFGDSSIVKLVKWRGEKTKLFFFEDAFKEVTGTNLKDFEEDWRRTMNAYYYSYLAQKEAIDEIGRTFQTHIAEVRGIAFSPDSSKYAIVGKNDKQMYDLGLYIVSTDSTHKVKEIFHGWIDSRLCWSPDGKKLAFGNYHRGENGSLIWDVYVLDVENGDGFWLTKDFRASEPFWSPDGSEIVLISHLGEATNLFAVSLENQGFRQITDFSGDVQIQDPKFSPDGQWLTFAIADENGFMDIAVVRTDGTGFRKLTDDKEVDVLPIWSKDGDEIIFTSFRNSTPNLFKIKFNSEDKNSFIQITDVGEAIFGVQNVPNSDDVLAMTLADVDTPRVVIVNPEREVENHDIVIRDRYNDWRSRPPKFQIQPIDFKKPTMMSEPKPYHFYNHLKNFLWGVFPSGGGIDGMSIWVDALGKHQFLVAGGIGWDRNLDGILATYVNACFKPILSVGYFFNTWGNYRYYNGTFLEERTDGLQIGLLFPINFGNSLSSNHFLSFGLTFQKRETELYSIDELSTDKLEMPEDGKEGIFSIEYEWLSRRPHKTNSTLPRNGFGLKFGADVADSNVFGKFSYSKIKGEVFTNVPFFKNSAIFGRVKFERKFGRPPAQDYVGLSNDPSIYVPEDSPWEDILDMFFESQENHNLRGWEGYKVGRQMVFGTAEWRVPLLSKIDVRAFGFSLGRVIGAVFSDFGNVWEGDEPSEWIVTAGAEIKNEIQLGGSIFLMTAYGVGLETNEWLKENPKPLHHFRLSLISPF